ncbi:MAG TPA: PAS domain S-box protein, partial [Terriglobales bacterium]|nr:PAS domain S-box protein [Terriglobales bacterium]
VRCELESAENGTARLVVADSGPGIRPEMREVVFERFRQVDEGTTRRFGGTGLGLAIVKDFVELHRGRVVVEQAPEGGAQLVVEIPLLAPESAEVVHGASASSQIAAEAAQAVDVLRPTGIEAPAQAIEIESALASAPLVLVVEDNVEMNRFIVESLASEYRVISALNGREGLNKAIEVQPDVILSDIMMPEMSGEDLLHELRSKPEFEGVPVILLTARADQDARIRVLREGAQDYIMKPFSVEELRVRVRNLASMSQTRKVLQQELHTHNHDVEQLAHEVSLRKRQLHSALDALRASEARFRRLAESNILGVITAVFGGIITDANDAFLRMVGYSREDLAAGKLDWQAMTPQEYAEADQHAIQQLVAAGAAAAWEKEIIRKDGSRVPVLAGSARIEGAADTAISFVLDLTEQKRSEARIAVQYGVARILSESSELSDASGRILEMIGRKLCWDYGEIWDISAEHKYLQCVDTWTAHSVHLPEFQRFTHGRRFDRSQGLPGRVWSTSAPAWITDLRTETNFVRAPIAAREGLKSAFGFPILLNNEVLGVFAFFSREAQEPDQELLELMNGIGNQIGQFVERKRWEAALRTSERRFRSVVEAMPQIVWTATPDGALDFYNQRWYDYTGLSYEQSKGWGWQPVLHPDDLQRTLDVWSDAVRSGNAYQVEYRFRRHDGVYRWHLGRAVPLRDSEGRILKWFGTSTDIDEQKRAEAAKAELAAIVESSEDAIIGKTLTGIITSWNAAAERIYGYKAEEIIGRSVSVLAPPERLAELRTILDRLNHGRPIDHMQTVRITKDGRRIDVSLSISLIRNAAGEVIGASTIARDVTEIRRAEAALRNSEKHATVGRLAATMAHEINNPLEAVSNVLYLLSTRSGLDEESRQYLSIAGQEMDRIAHIVKQTLGFYRESASPVMVDMRQLVDSVLVLYSRKLQDKRIKVEKKYEEIGEVPAYPAEMRQIFSNLIINAIEADRDGGSLKVHITPSRDWSDPKRQGIRVFVCDNGTGIKPEDRRNLFEPFFTTKGEKGTGLGLWVSNGIVQKHGGTIRVRSSVVPGRSGTCFSVFLPSQLSTPPDRLAENRQPELFSITDVAE